MDREMLAMLIKQLERQGLGNMIPAHNPWDSSLYGMEQVALPPELEEQLRRKEIEKMIRNIKSMAYITPLVNKTTGKPVE